MPDCSSRLICLFFKQLLAFQLEHRPGLAQGFDLAAHHGEAAVGRSLVSGDDLELRADHVVEHGPVQPRCRAGRRHDQFVREDIFDLFHTGGVPRIEHRAVAQEAPDPIEPGGIGVEAGRARGCGRDRRPDPASR